MPGSERAATWLATPDDPRYRAMSRQARSVAETIDVPHRTPTTALAGGGHRR